MKDDNGITGKIPFQLANIDCKTKFDIKTTGTLIITNKEASHLDCN